MRVLRISALITLTLQVFLTLAACSHDTSDQKEKVVNSFDEIFVDSLIPIEGKSYAGYYIRITGYANDSVRIIPGLDEQDYYSFFFTDSIHEELSFDYYGTFTKHITFDPYKATEGYLKVEYELLGY